MADKANVLVITGPTATGKTVLSVLLAQRLNGEIICADSMQLYKGLTVGTAQATQEEMQGVAHHLVGFLPPEQRFSVADYVSAAAQCITAITARGHLPIVVGGTGLYIESLVKGIRFTEQKTDLSLRGELQKRLVQEGIEPLYEELCKADPDYAATLHKNNHGRVLRALELYVQTGQTMSQQLAQSLPPERPYHDIIVALNTPTREALYARIDARVDHMLQQGLLEEARVVYEHRDTYYTAAQAIGYKEFFGFWSGDEPLSTCVDKLKQASRHYAKRQLTWFRRMQAVHWLVTGAQDAAEQVQQLMRCANEQGKG